MTYPTYLSQYRYFKAAKVRIFLVVSNRSDQKFFVLSIFIFHRLRNKFLHLLPISLASASWELHQYLRRMLGPMKITKLTSTPGNRTRDLKIARPTLYLTTTDTTVYQIEMVSSKELREQKFLK